MKKFFLIVALVLAVVSSLVAGTMAAYTQTVDVTADDIIAKSFFINNTTSESFSKDVKLAPGDQVVYQITLNNAGEVDATVNLAAALSAAEGKTANACLKLTYSENGTSYSGTAPGSFTLAKGESKTLSFKVSWPYAIDGPSNTADNEARENNHSSVFSVSFNCTSVNGGASY